MAAVLNEALDEAVARSAALSRQLREMPTAARETSEKVRGVVRRVREGSEASHGLLGDAATRLREADAQLSAAHERSESEVAGLRDRLDDVHQRVVALLGAIKTSTSELGADRATAAAELDKRQSDLDARAHGLPSRMQAIETQVGEKLKAVREALDALQQAASEAQQDLHSAASAFSEGLHDLAERAQTHAQDCVTAVSEAVDEAGAALTKACGAVIEVHNRAMDLVRTKLHDEAPKWAETMLGSVRETAESIEFQCAKQDEALLAWSPQAESCASQIEQAAERVVPPLAEAARLK